jgi:hypothetical protein
VVQCSQELLTAAVANHESCLNLWVAELLNQPLGCFNAGELQNSLVLLIEGHSSDIPVPTKSQPKQLFIEL